jgi:NADPH:quinone reductase-like Zn-dependent oxidoreductase
VRLRVDRFAVTANNITYAVFGDVLGYWDFFPTEDATYGRVPAMGWGTVVESRADAISLGRRFYGWYPMSSHVVFTPTATKDGFRDDGAHRQPHAPVYRAYVATDADPMYPELGEHGEGAADGEDRHALLRGLFLTGFLAEEFFADGGGSGETYFGASRVIVLSASSKTAIGFAQRAHARGGIHVVGVTSAANRQMVEDLGFYDQVVSYDDIDTIPTDGGAVSIDMAGNPSSLAAVHQHFGGGLAYSMTVGRSHHDAPPAAASEMSGPEPQLFFAPSEVSRRQEQWGRSDYAQRCAGALAEFVAGSHDWMRVEHRIGPDATQAAWADVYAGAVAPSVGVVAVVGEHRATP